MKDTTGYTLIELVIIVTIIAFFFGMSLKLYTDFNVSKRLEGDARQFGETLELAKKKIAAGDTSGIDDECSLAGYKVAFSDSSYQLYAQCPTDTAVGIPTNLSQDTSFNQSGEVVFRPLAAGATASCIIITNSAGKCRIVNVTSTAIISVGDEQSSCTCS